MRLFVLLLFALNLGALPIEKFIELQWSVLQRSGARQEHFDPKIPFGKRLCLYAAAGDPKEGFLSLDNLEEHGLIYLPYPYITPGGRFNEMYGWDSYFITVGLLAAGHMQMAEWMVENQLYQVQHFGFVLNSNRTYHLTRSHPPLLTRMVLAVYGNQLQELKRIYPLLVKYHEFWSNSARRDSESTLCRYFDSGEGVPYEAAFSEDGHYETIKHILQSGNFTEHLHLYDPFSDTLRDHFYVSDRAMRESGFDVSFCFGPFGSETANCLPICLNSLLYQMERDLEHIANLLDYKRQKNLWHARRERRRAAINTYLWDEDTGLFYTYHVGKKKHLRYPFLTTYYPLWTGLASKEQAEALVKNLPLFEREHGVMMSTHISGCQWDAPYGWAPLHLIVVEGLSAYGYELEACRIAEKFVCLIEKEYERTGALFEKYDVEKGTSEVDLTFGYRVNETGFGWTNGVYLKLKEYLQRH